MLVPSPAFRSMSLGIMFAVIFVLAATLTLLPAVLAKLGPRVDKLALPWAHSGEHHSPRFERWGERLWRQPVRYGVVALAILIGLALPVTQLKTAMPSIKVVPDLRRLARRLQPGPGGVRSGRGRPAADRQPGSPGQRRRADRDPGSRGGGADADADQRRLRADHGDPQAGPLQSGGREARSTGSARRCPRGSLIGGAVAENHDLQAALSAKTPLVIGVVLALGFLLLLIALQAPLLAAVGVLTNLLATGAAFGVAKWIFQDGALHSLLGFQSQGFLDAWGPVFFFAMIFAISMDYTVFLLSAAKEHWDHTHDPREAMVGGVAHSGRVIFAAGAVMVAVFFTFALSGPLPPKEMGIILGVAVLLDAALIRLLLLPVLLRLMGKWAWYLPRWAHRVLPDVTFGHA